MSEYEIRLPAYTLTTPDGAATICHQVDGADHIMVFPTRNDAMNYVRGMRVPIYNVVELASLPELVDFILKVVKNVSQPPTRILFFASGDARGVTVVANSIADFLKANEPRLGGQ